MKKLTLTLETVTPLFLGGAEARGTKQSPAMPEIRPPSFRGALRYWLRAALGGVYGDAYDGFERVQLIESQVFGNAGNESTSAASSVNIRITNEKLKRPERYEKIKDDRGKALRPPAGRDYLYWSMDASGSDMRNNYQPPKYFFPSGSEFDLMLTARSMQTDTELVFSYASAALWLLIHLGGIGSRSRRTGGSLSAKNTSSDFGGLDFKLSRQKGNLVGQLSENLQKIRALFDANQSVSFSKYSAFDILHPQVCDIWLLGAWNNADVAVQQIGQRFQEFRDHKEPDHRNVANWLQGQTIPGVERAAFGLPIPYRYSNDDLSGTIQGRLGKNGIERRSSPLWLKVTKIDANVFIGIATIFKSKFLPDGEKLYAKRSVDERLGVSPPSNYHIITDWIQEKFPNSREVGYE